MLSACLNTVNVAEQIFLSSIVCIDADSVCSVMTISSHLRYYDGQLLTPGQSDSGYKSKLLSFSVELYFPEYSPFKTEFP